MKELKIRTATDTTLEVYAHFDLTHKSAMQINWKTLARDFHNFLYDNSSEQFYQALKKCFAPETTKEA